MAEKPITAARARTHARLGWTLLAVSLCFGATLEALEAFRLASWVADPWKERLWSLAHFHGAALALVNLVYVAWADAPGLSISARVRASRALIAASLLMPLGFFLGGFGHSESDPSLGILLVPLGALGVVYVAFVQAFAAWKR